MPIYEYTCSACGQTSEHLQRVSDPAPDRCEKCGATSTLAKKISHSSFQLKGGGWYKDLYAKPPPGKDTKSDGGDKKNGASESKPSAPPDKKASGTTSAQA